MKEPQPKINAFIPPKKRSTKSFSLSDADEAALESARTITGRNNSSIFSQALQEYSWELQRQIGWRESPPDPSNFLEAVGKNVNKYRKQAELSIYGAAKRAGCTQISWRAIEHGERDITIVQLDVIAEVLGVTPDQLLRWKGRGLSASPGPAATKLRDRPRKRSVK